MRERRKAEGENERRMERRVKGKKGRKEQMTD